LPQGIFLFRWSAKRGILLLGKHPEDLEVDIDLLTDALGLRILRERRPGFFTSKVRGIKLVAYTSGPDAFTTFGISLSPKEDELTYRGPLVRLVTRWLKTGEMPASAEEWESVWKYIIEFPTLSLEQRLADAFVDAEARMAHGILVELGILPLTDFIDRLQGEFPDVTSDVLASFIYTLVGLGVFGSKYDPKAMIDWIFLLRDVVFYRAAPPNMKEIASRVSNFERDYKEFARNYVEGAWEREQGLIPYIIMHSAAYKLLQEFRKKSILHRNEIPSELEDGLNLLLEHNIARESGDIYYLFTDIRCALLFPKYTIRRVLERVKEKEIDVKLALMYLEELKRSYL